MVAKLLLLLLINITPTYAESHDGYEELQARINKLQVKINKLKRDLTNITQQTSYPTPMEMVEEAPEPIKQKPPQMMDQDSTDQQRWDSISPIVPWDPKGYEQSVERAKKVYATEEQAKCKRKIRYYTMKHKFNPKNDFYHYKVDYWINKCKDVDLSE